MNLISRFDGWSKTASTVVLAVLLALTALTGLMSLAPIDVTGGNAEVIAPDGEPMSDVKLYRTIISDVQSGENYYTAVARHHRLYGYPLKPFVTVRLPTLAYLSALLGGMGTQFAVVALFMAMGLAWHTRLESSVPKNAGYAMLGVIACSGVLLCSPVLFTFHESWAALLIALSLALWRPGYVIASCAAGLAAALFRDLAIAYLFLMACAALLERRWQEAGVWTMAIAAMAGILYLHANAVSAILQPGDLASQGWSGMGGWPFYVASTLNTSLLVIVPQRLAQVLVPLSLFGWLAWRSDLSLRVLGLLSGYALMLMLFARQENLYWGLLTTPLLLAGVVPAAVATGKLVVQVEPGAWQILCELIFKASGLRVPALAGAPSKPTNS